MNFFSRDTKKVFVDDNFTLIGEGFRLTEPDRRIPVGIRDGVRNRHSWCFGTTGVGKSRLLNSIAEQDIRKGYSLCVIDPKNDDELANHLVQVALQEGRDEELIIINPIYPHLSGIIDPLSHHYMPEELVAHVVAGVEVDSSDKFFFNVAYEIASAIIYSKLMIAKAEKVKPVFNLEDIKNEIGLEEISELRTQIEAINDPEAEQLAKDLTKIINSPQDYYSKISSSLRVALHELTTGNIGQIIGKANENRFITRLEEGKPVILIVQLGSLLTRKAAATMGKVLLSMIQSLIGRVFISKRKLEVPLSIHIDEAQSVLYQGVDELFAKGGSANVYVQGYCQSLSQMYSSVGEEYAKTILDNTNTKLFMRVPDNDTATYISDQFGEYTRYTPFVNAGKNDSGMMLREVDEPYIRPQQVMELKPREFLLTTYDGKYRGFTAESTHTIIDLCYDEIEVNAR